MIDEKKIQEACIEFNTSDPDYVRNRTGCSPSFEAGARFAIAELEPLQESRDHWRSLEMAAQERILKLEADLSVAVEALLEIRDSIESEEPEATRLARAYIYGIVQGTLAKIQGEST